jgi:hypothetical protein
MNECFSRFQTSLSTLISQAEIIVADETPKGFENRRAYRVIEKLKDEIETALHELEYISMPAIEGKFREMDNEKFELVDQRGKYITHFSCGSRVEVYDPDEDKWHIGRVEHRMDNDGQGYYFVCGVMGNPFLYTGMRARIRRN